MVEHQLVVFTLNSCAIIRTGYTHPKTMRRQQRRHRGKYRTVALLVHSIRYSQISSRYTLPDVQIMDYEIVACARINY